MASKIPHVFDITHLFADDTFPERNADWSERDWDRAFGKATAHYSGRLGNPEGRGYGGSNVPWPFDMERAKHDLTYRAAVKAAAERNASHVGDTNIRHYVYAPIWRETAAYMISQLEYEEW